MTNNQHHIITVGISLLTNFEREFKTTREETLKKYEQVLNYIAEDPQRACAELNALFSKTNFLEKKQNIWRYACLYGYAIREIYRHDDKNLLGTRGI